MLMHGVMSSGLGLWTWIGAAKEQYVKALGRHEHVKAAQPMDGACAVQLLRASQ